MALVGGGGVDFGGDAHHARDGGGFGLSPAHATKAGGDKELAFQGAAGEFSGRIHDRNGGAVHDALRANVHVGAGGHLAVLRDAQGVHSLPVVGF